MVSLSELERQFLNFGDEAMNDDKPHVLTAALQAIEMRHGPDARGLLEMALYARLQPIPFYPRGRAPIPWTERPGYVNPESRKV